jgi:hypothetical protein|tara:strand:+ start:229 stop:1110 length:882 start_codon:yes stop_codon:yes gene_type:complete
MAQLTGNPIKDSYLGLIKTSDNAALQAAGTPTLTDGAGNDSMIAISQTELKLGTNLANQYIKQNNNLGTITTEIKDISVRIDDASSSQYAIVDATNAGIGSGANYFLANAAGSVIAGPLDLSNATVTGLPGGGAPAFSSTKIVSTTHVQNDIVQATFQIPANTFTTGDVFNIRSMDQRAGIDGTQYTAIWISDQQQTVGNSPVNTGANYNITQIQSSQVGMGQYNKNCYIDTTTSTTWIDSFSNELADEFQGGANVASNNIDWTADQYVYLQLYSDATVGTYTNYYIVAKKQN